MEQPNIKVGLENSTAITCEDCGGQVFREATYLRRISKLMTGSPEDMIVPIPTFACVKCNHVNEQFQLKDKKTIKQ